MFQGIRQLLLFASLATLSNSASALKDASSLSTIEYTPELIAKQDYLKGVDVSFTNGGVANIVSDTSVDVASNAETQALRQYATHKNLRIIYTVAEVAYRIIANKKGVTTLKDLKGKKIGTMPSTSAAYFVSTYLASAGLKDSDYTVVSGGACMTAPCGSGTLPYMLAHGSVDAIGFWEPTAELALEALGAANAVTFSDKTIYREIFNLHSTAEKLKDPTTRANIVAFLRAIDQAEEVFTNNPSSVWPRVASALGVDAAVLKAVWPVHTFNGTIPADLMNVLVAEDKWVAGVDRRTAMTQADLSNLIDPSVLAEARNTSHA